MLDRPNQPNTDTLDISVERHLASKGIPAAQEAVRNFDASLRERELVAALRQCRAWVAHWNDDRIAGIVPTEGSLRSAATLIDEILTGASLAEATLKAAA